MADHPLLFDDLLRTPNLRSKTYVVQEVAGRGLACIEVQARRLEDWFFARRWVVTRNGRRLLFWLLDEVEAHGYRFQVTRGLPAQSDDAEEPWMRASGQWKALTEEERRIHSELFPEEDQLLQSGYDWDHENVFREGVALKADDAGRYLEEFGGMVYEWVRVPEEFTWRRYPLYASLRKNITANPTQPEPIRGT